MRNFILFILTLLSKLLSACGFYPYGEDVRVSLFNPKIFHYDSYGEFYYSSNSFESFNNDAVNIFLNDAEPNIQLWAQYCKGKLAIFDIREAVYKLTAEEINPHSKNAMIRYLYQQKDMEALNYLIFAKNCEFLNSWDNDPWERQAISVQDKRTKLMNRAISLANKVKNEQMKKRYSFLAIRLAWYNQDNDGVASLFKSFFEHTTNKDILYYWSLYFKGTAEKDSTLANFELAQVFFNAPDKRFVCHQYFDKNIPIEQALKFAKTKEEKANVYLLAGIERYDKALPYLKKMYELNPTSDGLSFLLLREINKIEDFVFTPYYTLFQPSLSYNYWSEEGIDASILQTFKRSEYDRKYANEVLQFVNKVDLSQVENPLFWQCCKAYLQFITRENKYQSCLDLINKLRRKELPSELTNQLNIISALALTAKQKYGEARIPVEIESVLLENRKNGLFLFAIGKELEYLGNTTDAALLYSIGTSWYRGIGYDENSYVFWKASKLKRQSYSDYFTDYFDYLDVIYSPEQTERLIINIKENQHKKDSFSSLKYQILKEDIPRLYDLLGTKYIRKNNLKDALIAFEKAGIQYWNRAYTKWEDNSNLFDQNPFYSLKYTPTFIETVDTIRLNKYTITKQLMYYLGRALDKNEKERDYYYFLVANAYYNMGHEGNVYMMRRFGSWSSHSLSDFEDEVEFRQTNLAKQYYLSAMQLAQTAQFKALCLRMVTRCEKQRIKFKQIGNWADENDERELFKNKYYLKLQANYPDYFNDLVSNCDKFESYFHARR